MALKELKGKQRAFIVTDKPLFDLGYTDKVTKVLDEVNVHHQVWGGKYCSADWMDAAPGPMFMCAS